MRCNLAGFKQFVEDMDQSIEKKMDDDSGTPDHNSKMDYFGGLGDEMGMTWQDIVTSLSNGNFPGDKEYRKDGHLTNRGGPTEPWTSAHFGLGSPKHEIMYKNSAWKIVPGTLSANGADIMLVPGRHDRSYLKGGKMLNKGKPDKNVYHLNRQQLIKFLTGGWQPAIDAAAQGGAAGGGMPGAAPGGAPGAAPPGGMPGMPGGM